MPALRERPLGDGPQSTAHCPDDPMTSPSARHHDLTVHAHGDCTVPGVDKTYYTTDGSVTNELHPIKLGEQAGPHQRRPTDSLLDRMPATPKCTSATAPTSTARPDDHR